MWGFVPFGVKGEDAGSEIGIVCVCVCMSVWVCMSLFVSVCVYMSMCCVVVRVYREKKKGKKNNSETYCIIIGCPVARHSMKHSRIMGKEKKQKRRNVNIDNFFFLL